MRRAVAAIALAALLAACQQDMDKFVTDVQQAITPSESASAQSGSPAGQSETRVSWEFYTPLYDQGDHFKTLLTEDRKIEDAATLYLEQKPYFAENKAKQQAMLDLLAKQINEPKLPAMRQAIVKINAITWPAPVGEWAAIRDSLTAADAALTAYASHDILKETEFRADEATRLEKLLADKKNKIEADAVAQFKTFDHFGDKSFFNAYPVAFDGMAFMDTHYSIVEPSLAEATTKQIKAFAANYPKGTLDNDQWARVGGMFTAATLRETGKGRDNELATILNAVNAAKAAGFEPKKVPGLKIGFVEVTSKTLLAQGQVDFPATVDVDLPVEAVKADLDNALTNPTAKAVDYLIVFDVALAKASRRVTGIKQIASTVLVGHEKEPNPDYEVAKMNLVQAQTNLQTTQIQNSVNRSNTGYYNSPGAAILGSLLQGLAEGVAVSAAQDRLKDAMMAMQSTPQYNDKPIYKKYNFDKAHIVARKAMTVHYYVIDQRKKTYFKSTFDVNEQKDFDVAYRIANEDPEKNSHAQAFNSEKDVEDFEKGASSVKLTQLINHYLSSKAATKNLVSLAAIRQDMLKDKNTALANFKANTFDARPLNDPRFDSVVVIYTGGGSLGSGFFVKPDVVLTNWHVVEEFKFVEMKMYDGQETFGRVLAKDVRLDLALIQVQSRGKPVRFYTKNNVDLGSTTEAIGHPERHEFSITRGIISAVRKHFSINLPKGAGGDVLYVQTDTAINHGNSGGPLFLGDYVIGVNTWGEPAKVANNLGFAVHYSEILAFLKEHLSGFVVLK
jgi:serine protease Do